MHIRKKTGVSVLAMVIFMIGVTFIAYPSKSVQAQTKTFNLKYTGVYPPTDRFEVTSVWWCRELEKRSNGRVKINLYFNQALGKIYDYPKMLKGGVADIGQFTNAAAEFPVLRSFHAPYVIPSSVRSVDAFWTLYYKGFLKELDDFKPLWWQPTDTFYFMFRNKKVTKLEELKGLKIRGLPGFGAEFNEALGATGVAIPGADVYQALERGTVDGLSTVPSYAQSIKLHEVMKYWLWEPVFSGGNLMCMTKKLYNSFPPDIQVVIEQLNAEARVVFTDSWKTATQDKEAVRKLGWEVYELSPDEHARWKKVGQQVVDKWVAENEAKGIPARQVIELLSRVMNFE